MSGFVVPSAWAACFVSGVGVPDIPFGNGIGFAAVVRGVAPVGEYLLTLHPNYALNGVQASVSVQPSTFNPHGSTVRYETDTTIRVLFTDSAGAPSDTDFFITVFRTRAVAIF